MFVDGSGSGNFQRCGFGLNAERRGFGIHFPNEELSDISADLLQTEFAFMNDTPNTAELVVIDKVLSIAIENGFNGVVINSDTPFHLIFNSITN